MFVKRGILMWYGIITIVHCYCTFIPILDFVVKSVFTAYTISYLAHDDS